MPIQYIPVAEYSPQQLHIASLVAHVRPEHCAALRDWMLQQPQPDIHIEIPAESAQGKMVIVTESAAEKAIVNFLDELRGRAGVLNAALVYHEYLSAQDLQEEPLNEEHPS